MHADLIVAGMADTTQEAYLRAVRQLRDYYSGTDPDQLTEQQLKDYLLWLRHDKRELEDWHPPVLRSGSSQQTWPPCGHPLTFESFHRIRPPPLERRSVFTAVSTTRFESFQN